MGIQRIGALQLTNNVPGRAPMLRKTKSATLALTNGVVATVPFETTIENYGFTLPSTSVFAPLVRGLYRVNVMIPFASAGAVAATRRIVAVRDITAGTNIEPQASTPSIPTAGQDTNVQTSGVFDLDPAKTYDIRARQDAAAGGPFNVQTNATLVVEWVGPNL